MKRMLDQKLIDQLAELSSSGGIDYVSALKQKLTFDNDGDLVVGYLTATDIDAHSVVLPDLLSIQDAEGESLIPLENNAGKVLAVNEDEDGLEAVNFEAVVGVVGNTKLTDLGFTYGENGNYPKLVIYHNERQIFYTLTGSYAGYLAKSSFSIKEIGRSYAGIGTASKSYDESEFANATIEDILSTLSYESLVPSISSLDTSKTYVLKATFYQGQLKVMWVEETA